MWCSSRVALWGLLMHCLIATAPGADDVSPAPIQGRQPVPAVDALEAAAQQVQLEFQAQLNSAKLAGDKVLLAEKLLAASEIAADPALRYALLTEGLELSIEAGNPAGIFQFSEVLARVFAVDCSTMQLESLRRSAKLRREPLAQATIAASAIDRLVVLSQADQYAMAVQMSALAKNAATTARSKHLAALAQHHSRRWGGVQKEFEALSEHVQQLESQPNDREAHAALGVFYCFNAGDWERGVRHLSEGIEGALQTAADAEHPAPTAPKEQFALGELWESAATEALPMHRSTAERRARHWYERAAAQMTGAERAALLQRIARLSAPAAQLRVFINDADGEGHLSVTAERIKWRQLSYVLPTSVQLNDYRWDPAAGDEVANRGATQILPEDVCYSTVQLVKVRGRGAIEVVAVEPTGVVIEVNDVSPPGSDDYEFILRFREQ
jgi:hypothetical protein